MGGPNGEKPAGLTEGDPLTASSREARRWVAIYKELVQMETNVIQSVRDRLSAMSAEARQITERTNLPQLQNDVELFRARLALWQERLAQLEA